MRTQRKNILKIALAALTLLIHATVFSQASVIANTSSNSGDFVGWNTIPTFDLDLKHEGNYRVVFSTAGTEHLGILTNANDGKVVYNIASPVNAAQFSIRANFPVSGTNVGVRSTAASGFPSYAGFFTAEDNLENAAVYGAATDPSSQENYGVAGYACASGAGRNNAIYGLMKEDCFGWAGYFNGSTFTPGGAWTSSDENLKSNIQDLENGMDVITQLAPKLYEFEPTFDKLTLPEGVQYGLLAQELEAVLPSTVRNVVGSNIDQEGTFSFKAVNYQHLVPILISAFQERQAELNQQQELITQLEQAIEAAEMQLSLLNE